ncbi:IS1 family transposase [Erwiniaceae bacterium CAU 1747]
MASVTVCYSSGSATEGVVPNGKSNADHQCYLCSHYRQNGKSALPVTLLSPVRIKKSLIFP